MTTAVGGFGQRTSTGEGRADDCANAGMRLAANNKTIHRNANRRRIYAAHDGTIIANPQEYVRITASKDSVERGTIAQGNKEISRGVELDAGPESFEDGS